MSLKILILSDAWYPQVNGVVRTYENLQRELQALGHTVRIIGPRDCPTRIPLPFYAEIELAIVPKRAIERIITAEKPDIIHIATEGPIGRAARAWCLRHKHAFTTCYHTHFPDYVAKRLHCLGAPIANAARALAWRWLRHFHAPARCIYTATASLERELQAHGFTGPFQRLSRGIQTDIFHPHPRPNATNLEHVRKPIALYVGRVAAEKNLPAFCDMAWPGSKIVVGGGPDLPALQARYPDVVFMGVQIAHTLADLYRQADVFVFPSRTDTFGMVLVEALACGVPIAAYPVPGPQDIVTSPALGCLHDDLAIAAQTALQTGNREECAAHAASTYNWASVAAQFLAPESKTPCPIAQSKG
jgi:glycosyltransferase involved in cell wall biosynthesis